MDEHTMSEDMQQMSGRNYNIDCHDQVNPWTGRSDCPKYKCLCNSPQHYAWVTALCPKTCNRCDEDNHQPTQSPAATRSPAANPGTSYGSDDFPFT
ncbi:shTK domain protein [Ancylostoma ceylanicum]|uniref:ShTK domain protein n=1 Tax=Ancylostoma ceylanicum TaxID=53326 RepID=A0A0D6M1F1_9BILA|nr:shTK domain protein [Ancylostoma ceylanicum]